jgi:predicted P-loop ATPase
MGLDTRSPVKLEGESIMSKRTAILCYVQALEAHQVKALILKWLTETEGGLAELGQIIDADQEVKALQVSIDRTVPMESQAHALKLAALKQDIQVGTQQLKNGQYHDYNEDELDVLFEDIQREGRQSPSAPS